MKKLVMLAIALNLAACSTDNNESTSTELAQEKQSTFNPNPTPSDYAKANYPSFIENQKTLSASETGKKAAVWVNTYVPNAAFRTRLISIGAGQEDANPNDNYIDIDKSRGGLFLDNAGITDLTGIQAFTSLSQLIVSNNLLTTLNVSALTSLTWIECQNNQLTSLNLSANTNLYQVWCQNNLLTSLTLPASTTTLWGVWCYGNQLATLNLNGNNKITDLFCQTNQLTTLALSPLTELKQTNVSANKWVTLNYNSNSKLIMLYITNCSLITDISIKNGNNAAITNQSFQSNAKSPKIHVDDAFLINANTAWPNKGTSTYVL
ncbi:leucine-rich repeat domain-containing protein [Flavobacterium johnsoniae]|uniref:Leucine-rich repeat domain-containing protein n=1 Tax=Flavobacterium johnsoniae TaxID=986 RepID=A0A1M5J4U3_FLAJO|nr:hypothetical protein [Flavobacterium johnsoniae]SHG35586.1 hypothetical protein SAMN05444388_102385 [Flavobacterium johnsoniae]